MRIDHIILACADLDADAAAFSERTGLGVLPGGVHPAWGTRNAIVPLGGAYVELVGVEDAAVAAGTAFGRAVAAGAGAGSLIGWAVEPEDFPAATARAGVDAMRGARERPDGTLLSWSMAGADEALPRGLPFFLKWDAPEQSPARAAVEHRAGVQPVDIAWIQLPQVDGLDAWLGSDHGLDVRAGSPPRAAIALRDGSELLVP
jgi:Glyoxalase-like domain